MPMNTSLPITNYGPTSPHYSYPITNITVGGEALEVTHSNTSTRVFPSQSVSPLREKHPAYVAGELLHRWVGPMVQGVSAAFEWFTGRQAETPQSSLGADTKSSASADPQSASAAAPHMLSSPAHAAVHLQAVTPMVDFQLDLAGRQQTLNGAQDSDRAGSSISAGDVNGDGVTDFIIGAPGASPQGRLHAGQVMVVFGPMTSPSLELSALSAGQGLVIQGAQAGDRLGTSVNGVGDLNSDGLADIALGAPISANLSD